MSTNNFAEQYKKIHKGNFKTLMSIYWSNKPVYYSIYFWVAIILTLVINIFVFVIGSSFMSNIEFFSDKMTSIMPNILGFNLGGYVLLIGLNSQSILDEITEPIGDNKYSLFQKKSAVFAFSIIIQAASILLGFTFL